VDDRKGNKKLILTIPNGRIHLSNNVCNDAYAYDAKDFCLVITNGVKRWLVANEKNEIIQKNLQNLLQYRVHGMAPYIVGLPIIVIEARL
jgi:hypothetical protein